MSQATSNPYRALDAFCLEAKGEVLNIGDVNTSSHTQAIKQVANVITVSLQPEADISRDYNDTLLLPFDAIWCAHCLEHQRNVGAFLDKVFKDLKEGGLLCITVPPRKDNIVGGHLSLWNAGLLLYNLILAGFDCSQARVMRDGYNITVMVRKKAAKLPNLDMDNGDIEKIAHFFPFDAVHGFDGNIDNIGFDV